MLGTFEPLVAQQIRMGLPQRISSATQGGPEDDGSTVEMFENPKLDLYLRKAQDFLAREDYAAAIQVLQDVVEGKTVEIVGGPAEPPAGPSTATPSTATPPTEGRDRPAMRPDGSESRAAPPAASAPQAPALDARRSVFSQDGRLFRPVRRLCHELLASLPAVGIELYRANYEVSATELLDRAEAEGSVSRLEAVINRYFVTLAAGRAMVQLGDRLMHEGRYRAAVQVLRDLVELYPADNRKRLGISDAWCGFKMVLCLRLAGEVGAAKELAGHVAEAHPDDTLRVLGELHAVRDLPNDELFAGEVEATRGRSGVGIAASWLSPATEALIPMWQYRFRAPDPYREPKASNDDNRVRIIDESGGTTLMPHAARYGGGTWVTFSPAAAKGGTPAAVFLEHFRLRLADASTGVMLKATDVVDEPPPPRENHPRVRIAANDFALLRPVEDEERRYVVVGHKGKTTVSVEALRSSELVAYERESLQVSWTSQSWLDGEDGLRDVTFLAAPIVHGERLLLPSLRRGAYTLSCVDRSSGRPIWHTPLHVGGSAYWKAPGVPVVVQGGIAYVATNAGCVAAVDAFSGDLRWIRRYERTDPLRGVKQKSAARQQQEWQFGAQFQQGELKGFFPSDLIVRNGLVVLAAVDSELVLCVDGATGAPLWYVDGVTRYAPYRPLRALVGATDDSLYVVSDRFLVCIDLAGGLVRWSRELPTLNGRQSERGRGLVLGDQVVLPSDREVLLFDVAGKGPMRRLPLPAFGASRDPLGGPCTLTTAGPWLAVGYQGGIEVFSSRDALRELAKTTSDPLRRAEYLVQSGDAATAEKVLAAALQENKAGKTHAALAEQLLSLVRDRAAAQARGGDLAGALAAFDSILASMTDRDVRQHWHLARLEICKAVGDLRAHEREQQRLYDFMEGKG